MDIKIMVVPGKITKVTVPNGSTVLNVCEAAAQQIPGVDWVGLAKDREVRVQNRKFSNSEEIKEGTFGSISRTPLNDGDVVLILTKIKGNTDVGDGVLSCTINGEMYALESPEQVGKVLETVLGMDLSKVQSILINGAEAAANQLVGSDDDIKVVMKPEPQASSPAMAAFAPPTPTGDVFETLRAEFADKDARIAELENQVELLSDRLQDEREYIDGVTDEPVPTVFFGRLGQQLRLEELEEGDTLADLMDNNDVMLGANEAILYNGTRFKGDAEEQELANGDSVLIVPTTKNGLRVKMTL